MANKTVTVRPSGGTYTTLAAAITGEVTANANLVTMAGILTILIEGDWSGGADSTYAYVSGFTTNATYYLKIVCDSANKAGTSWSTSKYRLEGSGSASAGVLRIGSGMGYVVLEGLQIKNTSQSYPSLTASTNTRTVVRECFIKAGAGSSLNSTNAIVVNSIFIGGAAFQLRCSSTSRTITALNSVFIGGAVGLYCTANNTLNAKNCYCGGTSSTDYLDEGTMTLTTCFSEDGTESTSTAAYSTDTFTNVTAGSEDFALPVGSALIDEGTDLSADATYPFNWDILGNARGLLWDVGAVEYVSSEAYIVDAGGIASGESFGSPILSLNILPESIASAETFGSPSIALTVSPESIASAETFGEPAISLNILTESIISGESFGTPEISVTINPIGIPSAESFGSPSLLLNISPIGIVSGESFGLPIITPYVTPHDIVDAGGIASEETFGQPSIITIIQPISITSGEAIGSPTISLDIQAIGIASAESFGLPTVSPQATGLGKICINGAWRNIIKADILINGAWRDVIKTQVVFSEVWKEVF